VSSAAALAPSEDVRAYVQRVRARIADTSLERDALRLDTARRIDAILARGGVREPPAQTSSTTRSTADAGPAARSTSAWSPALRAPRPGSPERNRRVAVETLRHFRSPLAGALAMTDEDPGNAMERILADARDRYAAGAAKAEARAAKAEAGAAKAEARAAKAESAVEADAPSAVEADGAGNGAKMDG
jgi:hypothetical protein